MSKVRLGDVCDIKSGGTPSRSKMEYWDGDIPWVKISDFSSKYIDKTSESISELGLNNSSAKWVEKGSVLFTIFATLGEVAILNIDATTNQAIAALTIKNDHLNIDYLFYFLCSQKNYVNKIGRGVAQNNINMSILRDIEMPFPQISTQRFIAATLDKLTNLISLSNMQLNKLDELIKSRFVEMFGDPVINPMKWAEEELSQHLNVIGGYAFKSDSFQEKGVPVLRIGNINTGIFCPINLVFWEDDNQLDRYKIIPGDLVMSLTGTVGKDDYGNVCILGDEYGVYYLNQRNAKLDLYNTVNKYYLSFLLQFREIKKRLTGISRGVRQANISNKDILNLCVPIPPISLQNQFADFVEQVEKQKSAVQKSIDKLEILKKSLMQEYFG